MRKHARATRAATRAAGAARATRATTRAAAKAGDDAVAKSKRTEEQAITELFRKRIQTLERKSKQLGLIVGTDVILLVRDKKIDKWEGLAHLPDGKLPENIAAIVSSLPEFTRWALLSNLG